MKEDGKILSHKVLSGDGRLGGGKGRASLTKTKTILRSLI